MIRIIRKHRATKVLACLLAISFVFDFLWPTKAFASGPNQPEFTAFGHASMSELVNTANGDFSYNIPLLDIEGYPINITYNAGSTMDQEASWVGLGWSLNPGALNRTMRGIPDDFKGENIEQEISMKTNYTFGAEVGAGGEFLGAGDNFGVNLGAGMGVFYNNYKGLGINRSINFGISAGKFFSAGVGIDANSQEGITISPSVSLTGRKKGSNGNSASASVGLGTSYNTRSGLSDLSLSLDVGMKQTDKIDGEEVSQSLGISSSASIPIGTSTYFPSIQFPRRATATELRAKVGTEVQGGFIHGYVKGYLMTEEISNKYLSSEAYGYLYAHAGQDKLDAIHDFNRTNDGMVSSETPNLPLTNQTYDIFTATAQGLSSMFRAHRSEVGTVYDNQLKTTNSSDKFGVEVGFGTYAEGGGNTNNFDLEQSSGKWTAFDNAKLDFIGNNHSLVENNYEFEEAYFSQSGEGLAINEAYYNALGGDEAVRLQLNGNEPSSITSRLVNRSGSVLNANIANVHNPKRTKRGVVINYLNAKQAKDYALEKKIESHTLNNFDYAVAATSSADHIIGEGHYTTLDGSVSDRIGHADNKEHHISEVSVTDQGGKRFVYGIPSYTRAYEERSFNVSPTSGFNSIPSSLFDDGLKSFSSNENSINNSNKKDGFFQKKSVPDYATSYLLTAVLSTDYVDVSGNGPSVDDLGTYTKFNYTRIHANYGWKQPYEQNMANFNAGFRSDKKDDRASYMKGQKEIWYLHSIETKNYIAEFDLEQRVDAIEADFNSEGGQGSAKMYALKEIRLYARKDKETNGVSAVPIKTVHFKYSNTLCNNLPAHTGIGKLTLDEIYFTHGQSQKAWFSPYQFFYADPNHNKITDDDPTYNEDYDYNSYDRWGNFKKKKTGAGQNLRTSLNLSNSDFPYVNNYPNNHCSDYQPDVDAAMWALHTIKLPSGGTVEIDYEADDYAYVQNKRAGQMMKIAGTYDGSSIIQKLYADANNMFGGGRDPHLELVVDLPVPIKASSEGDAMSLFTDRYLREENQGALATSILGKLYYKCAVNTGLESDEYDFVTGYADIDRVTGMLTPSSSCTVNEFIAHPNGGSTYYTQAVIKLKPAKLKDNERGSDVNPISKATWQMVRTYLYKLAFPAGSMEDDNPGLNEETIQLLFSFIEDIRVMIRGVNTEMRRKGIGQKIVPGKSFVRLHNPTYKKIGGGHRVKQVLMVDEWASMNTDANPNYVEDDAVYGKVYSYNTTHPTLKDENGNALIISSGVASYEPQIGGDENPFRRPIEYELKRHLYANDILYAEAPFGEVFFPSPSVIYSHVKVRDYVPPGVNRTVNGTGESVFEYYTAYDYPIKVDYTPPQKIEENPNPITSLFSMKSTYELAMSQGYSVVLNDMHGKPKGTTIYGEGRVGDDFISKMEYFYKSMGGYHKELDNRISVLAEDGSIENNVLVNVDFDMVHDSKQTLTKSKSRSYQANVNVVQVPATPPFPLPIPSFFMQKSDDTKRHKMSVITKVVQKYGILEKTIAEDQQARIETRNELYDKETGQVLLSRVTNQYDKANDHRSMTYPAHWAYDRMGPAYKNIDKEFTEQTAGDVVDQFGYIQSPYDRHFVVGDEVMVYDNNGNADQKYWVIYGKCTSGRCNEGPDLEGLFLIDRNGILYNSIVPQTFQIIRSGRRNQAAVAVGNFTAKQGLSGYAWKDNSLANFKVLNSSAQEFTEYAHYQLYGPQPQCNDNTINPFVWGVMGNWRPTKSWVYNVERDYSNGNLKNDGYFNMKPFWVWDGAESQWESNGNLNNWQTVTENTLHHASGFTIENRNEIGTYVAQLPSLNNTVVKAVANNARYREMLSESFEDFNMLNDNYDNGFWTYLCTQNRVGLYQGAHDNTITYTNSTAHTGNYSVELPVSSDYALPDIRFRGDKDLTVVIPEIPYQPQGWEKLQEVSFAEVSEGEEAGFVISYWKRLGTELDYDVKKALKDQYDPVSIEVEVKRRIQSTIFNFPHERKTQKSVIIDGWQKVDEIITFTVPQGLQGIVYCKWSFKNTSSTQKGYIDDIRIHPLHSNMVSHVYDIYTNRKVAELDANNFATFYEYNEEGTVIRVKKETERGIVTVQESRDFTVRN